MIADARYARRLLPALACLLAFAFVLAGPASAAVDRPAIERAFRQWLANDIWPAARAEGVSRATFDAALGGATLDWSLPELNPPGSSAPHVVEHQAEFRSPAAYFDEGRLRNEARVAKGQLDKWSSTLTAIEKKYGVPGEILIAIWGRETGFGRAALPYAAIPTLATHAFMSRRKDFFRPELIAALKIVQTGDIRAQAMRSSWAGALGQPQFLPSYFLKYAVDFDGDGRRDIWSSVPDTLASMANFLRQEGWNPDRGWGIEAKVPAAVACSLEGPEQGKGMGEWAALGVTQIDGRPLPGVTANRQSFLMMPAGRLGPAFIVSGNFYVLKAYNYSDLYALYVGHLADRMSGDNNAFAAKWGKVGGLSRADVAAMQKSFEADGHDVGGADGLVGFKTRVAVGRAQAKAGQPVTCMPDAAMAKRKG